MKNFLLLVIIIAGISSCHKKCHRQNPSDLCAEPQIGIGDCITDSNQLKTLILGKWNWTQTWVWGQVENPCTKNLNYSYEFMNDGSIKHFENGERKETKYYHIVTNTGSQIIMEDSIQHLYHPLTNPSGWLKVCGNYLLIDNSPVDGPKITFLREN